MMSVLSPSTMPVPLPSLADSLPSRADSLPDSLPDSLAEGRPDSLADSLPLPLPVSPEAPSEEALVRDHLDLVRRMVTQTTNRLPSHVSRDDLLSAGMAGLLLAARHLEPARGVPFERYAATRIRGALLDELRSFDW